MMQPKDKIILITVIGILGILGILCTGEIVIIALNGGIVNTEIITLIKMSITGLIGMIAGYMGGKSK